MTLWLEHGKASARRQRQCLHKFCQQWSHGFLDTSLFSHGFRQTFRQNLAMISEKALTCNMHMAQDCLSASFFWRPQVWHERHRDSSPAWAPSKCRKGKAHGVAGRIFGPQSTTKKRGYANMVYTLDLWRWAHPSPITILSTGFSI